MARSPSAKAPARQAARAMRSTGGATTLLRGFHHMGDAAAVAGEFIVALLPFGRAVRRRDLNRRDLVFGAVGRPVRVVGGDDVGLGFGVMERGVDHARRHPLGDEGAQRGLAGAARELHPVAVADAALLGIVRMHLQAVLLVPDYVRGAPGLGADIVLAE